MKCSRLSEPSFQFLDRAPLGQEDYIYILYFNSIHTYRCFVLALPFLTLSPWNFITSMNRNLKVFCKIFFLMSKVLSVNPELILWLKLDSFKKYIFKNPLKMDVQILSHCICLKLKKNIFRICLAQLFGIFLAPKLLKLSV